MSAVGTKNKNGLKIVICVQQDEPGFHAFCPNLSGIHTYGMTEEEAVDSAKDAITAYLKSLIKHNESIPAELFYREESGSENSSCIGAQSYIQNLELVPA